MFILALFMGTIMLVPTAGAHIPTADDFTQVSSCSYDGVYCNHFKAQLASNGPSSGYMYPIHSHAWCSTCLASADPWWLLVFKITSNTAVVYSDYSHNHKHSGYSYNDHEWNISGVQVYIPVNGTFWEFKGLAGSYFYESAYYTYY